MLILCIRSNKVGKRKPGLLSCDSDQTPVYVFQALPAWLLPGLARALPYFRGAKSRSQGESFLLLLAPHITEETGSAPALVTLSQAASPQTSNSEVADGLSLKFHPGPASTGQEGPIPTPKPVLQGGK